MGLSYWDVIFEPLDRTHYEYGMFNFTNSLGRWSPILRFCYKIGGEIDKNWNYYWAQWTSFTTIYSMFKANVVRNYTDIDDRSSSLYDSVFEVDLP